MAHFAQLDNNNIVLQVIVVPHEHEANGEEWCANHSGGRWKQTSYTGKIRKNYAGIGYTYDEQRDAFIAPKPFPSWVLNETTCTWVAPNIQPTDGYEYRWSELVMKWLPKNKWLFENYGLTQDISLIAPTVAKYELEDKKLIKVIDKPDYIIRLEKANHILFVHAEVPQWTSEIKKAYQTDIDILHREIGTTIYAYHTLGNIELPDSILQLKKFAEIFGFVEFENVELADGLEHFILKREVPSA